MALEGAITAQTPQYGIWITPQAASASHAYQTHPGLYLNGSRSNLLNLLLPEAQDLFFDQFSELITRFNCSRIWFDYNTDARLTHWNAWEAPDRQGLLELGFYHGLYAVFDRTRREYPNVRRKPATLQYPWELGGGGGGGEGRLVGFGGRHPVP